MDASTVASPPLPTVAPTRVPTVHSLPPSFQQVASLPPGSPELRRVASLSGRAEATPPARAFPMRRGVSRDSVPLRDFPLERHHHRGGPVPPPFVPPLAPPLAHTGATGAPLRTYSSPFSRCVPARRAGERLWAQPAPPLSCRLRVSWTAGSPAALIES